MNYALRRTVLSALMLAAGAPCALGQSRVAKQVGSDNVAISGPATLEATMTNYGAWLRWSPVNGATGYNVTRMGYAGTPETLIASRATVEYAFQGNNCTVGDELPFCVFFDNQFRTTASNLTVTYRVYAIVPAARVPVVSAPSPPASLVWNCPNCPKLP